MTYDNSNALVSSHHRFYILRELHISTHLKVAEVFEWLLSLVSDSIYLNLYALWAKST